MNDENDILKIHDKWLALEESGNTLEVLDLCDRDVAWLVPGSGMLKGIDEVRSFLGSQSGATIISIDAFDVEVELSGTLAVKKARFCTTLMDGASELQVKGAHIWTLRKNDESNQWQVASVAWSIDDGCP
jgi:hypothetical protein